MSRMKKLLFAALITTFLFSCSSEEKKDKQEEKTENTDNKNLKNPALQNMLDAGPI
jgi:PBP1b-binding outer membrane lipoprotein LpoB